MATISGQPRVLDRPGNVPQALRTAVELEADGIPAEVRDPRTLLPLDRDVLAKSVHKTGRLVIFDESTRFCGYVAEIAAFAAEELWGSLKQPIWRLTRREVASYETRRCAKVTSGASVI